MLATQNHGVVFLQPDGQYWLCVCVRASDSNVVGLAPGYASYLNHPFPPPSSLPNEHRHAERRVMRHSAPEASNVRPLLTVPPTNNKR